MAKSASLNAALRKLEEHEGRMSDGARALVSRGLGLADMQREQREAFATFLRAALEALIAMTPEVQE